MKKIISLALSGFGLFISISALAQTYAEEALLFSRINPGEVLVFKPWGDHKLPWEVTIAPHFKPSRPGFF